MSIITPAPVARCDLAAGSPVHLQHDPHFHQETSPILKSSCCLFSPVDVILSISGLKYFPTSLTVKWRRVARTGDGGLGVTSQRSVVLISLSLSLFQRLPFLSRSAPPFASLSPSLPLALSLFSPLLQNSSEICAPPRRRYIQSNLITAITFLLG